MYTHTRMYYTHTKTVLTMYCIQCNLDYSDPCKITNHLNQLSPPPQEEVGHHTHKRYSHMTLVCTLRSYMFRRMQFARLSGR